MATSLLKEVLSIKVIAQTVIKYNFLLLLLTNIYLSEQNQKPSMLLK